MRLARLWRLGPLYFIFALILGAALALGRYSYNSARLLADETERSLGESNRLLGEQMLLRIDNFIIDTDRSLIDVVDLERLQDISRRWTEVVRLSAAIDGAVVLDERQEIIAKDGFIYKRRGEEADRFREFFERQIKPELKLAQLDEYDSSRHLHVIVDGNDYLISYVKRKQQPTRERPEPRAYYIALKISLDYLRSSFFHKTFEPLRDKADYAVVDKYGRVVFGKPVSAPEPLLYSKYFPTTLYLWRLQMAPPDAARLSSEAHKRRITDTSLIALMVAAILLGIVFLLYAVSAERRANALKSEFISNVSHELKTPLSLIRMFGELLATNRVKSVETGREYAEIITRESERLSRLIDNVLDFSRIERGKAAYDFQSGHLADVVARGVDVYRHRLEREAFTLKLEIEPELPEILFDESAMTLVLLNLLDNALKYGHAPTASAGSAVPGSSAAGSALAGSPAAASTGAASPPGGRIEVSLRREGHRLNLSVRDFGPGIPREEQRLIFDRFYRSRHARAQNARGSGIGLSLVKHIAESHGGRVYVESELGRGATFTVSIPMLKNPVREGRGEGNPAAHAA